MDFNFFMPVKVVSGKGALAQNCRLLTEFGSRCLIVTTKTAAEKSGAANDINASFAKENIHFAVYDEIGQNPRIDKCYEAAQRAREYNVDFILGVGGGSALDAAKATAVYATNPHLSVDEIYSNDIRNAPLPLALIGTTAGTGSEVSGVSVLTHHKTGRKKSISGKNCYAKVAFADPRYTYSMPYDVTVSTALDSFSHAVEAWFSPKMSSPVRLLDMAGLNIVWEMLKKLKETKQNPSEKERDLLYYASLYTGMALNACGTAFPHTLSYVLTEDFSVPHGKACCTFLPYHIERGIQYEPAKASELLSLLGASFEQITSVLGSLVNTNGISMTEEQTDAYVSRWSNVGNFYNSPGSYTQQDAKALLKKLFVK